ncbi:hypothetical protein ACFOY5_18600 [Massilia aurea]|uniref:hypothetical protein n=1 Tax=Massilia aurea TaxID=373040 RepID=UPI0031DDB18A
MVILVQRQALKIVTVREHYKRLFVMSIDRCQYEKIKLGQALKYGVSATGDDTLLISDGCGGMHRALNKGTIHPPFVPGVL